MSRPAISVEGLSKRYQIGLREARHTTLREAIMQTAAAPLARLKRLSGGVPEAETFWALKDVSFDVQPGEVVGIIGRNGAGKSTLLKVLSRITEPTSGRAVIRGRVGSLLEVGTGFHTELTGRENVYLNGSILGMSRREIDRKFDEIVDFSGVEKFIDTPVKRYSSGMTVRLGFAVAAHLEPEILIVDEVLAVGDFEFQKKCLGKMNEVAGSGRTVLFVSHNMAAVESLCTRAIMLEAGCLTASGDTFEVLRQYQRSAEQALDSNRVLVGHPGRSADSTPIMRSVALRDSEGQLSSTYPMGTTLQVEVAFSNSESFSPVLGVVVKTELGTSVFGIDNRIVDGFVFDDNAREGRISCRIAEIPLVPGGYTLDLYLGDRQRSIDRVRDAISFSVIASDVFGTGKLPPAICGPVWRTAEFELECSTLPADAGDRRSLVTLGY